MTVDTRPVAEIMAQRQRQYLVHSFIYYELGDSIVSDAQYERWYDELRTLQQAHPDEFERSPYRELCRNLDGSYTCLLTRRKYPPEIVTSAFRVLARAGGKTLAEVAAKYGCRVLENEREA